MKKSLIKRSRNYYILERLHTLLTFPLLIVFTILENNFTNILLLLYGLFICIFILAQGQHYWKLKFYVLSNKYFDQRSNIRFFKSAKKINIILISLIPLIAIIQVYLFDWIIDYKNKNIIGFSIVANLFAILEHINYYNIQLMIDKKSDLKYLLKYRRFKVASLKKDLLENKI